MLLRKFKKNIIHVEMDNLEKVENDLRKVECSLKKTNLTCKNSEFGLENLK